MKTVTSLGTGGTIIHIWSNLPRAFRFLLIVALAALSGAELNVVLNESTYSGAIESGKGAQGAAQIADPRVITQRYRNNLPVTAAQGLAAADIAGRDAQARQVGAEATAMNENTADLNARYRQGGPLTTTEDLKRIQIATAQQELLAKTAEAQTKIAEASAARAKADADIASSHFVNGVLGSPDHPASLNDVVNNAMNSTMGGLNGMGAGGGNSLLGIVAGQHRAVARR